jgi:hypothetical protein
LLLGKTKAAKKIRSRTASSWKALHVDLLLLPISQLNNILKWDEEWFHLPRVNRQGADRACTLQMYAIYAWLAKDISCALLEQFS